MSRGLKKTSDYEKYFFDSTSHDLQVASLVCFHEEEEASRSLSSPLLDHQKQKLSFRCLAPLSFLTIFTSIPCNGKR